MMKRILSSESKEIWKIETGSGPICRFLERRESFRYPTESAYRIWERSTLFWNIFIPSKSKKKQTPRNATWIKKYSTFERVTCSRNILRGEKKETKIIKYFSLQTKDCTFLKINGLTSRSCTCCTWRYYFWMKCRSSTISFISNLDREVLLWMLKHH